MLKILFVDDEPWVIKGLEIMIDWEKLGVEPVGAAENVEDAVEMINTLRPDIVITDIQMDSRTGLDLLETYSTKKYKPEFLMLTGYGELDYIRSSMKYGASGYLMKPIDPDEITETVREVCEKIYNKREREKEQNEVLDAVIQETFQRILFGEESEELYHRAEFLLGIHEEQPLSILIFRNENGMTEDEYKECCRYSQPLMSEEGMCRFNIGYKTYVIISTGQAASNNKDIAERCAGFFTSTYIADVNSFAGLAEVYNRAVESFSNLRGGIKVLKPQQQTDIKITINTGNILSLAMNGMQDEAVQQIKDNFSEMKADDRNLDRATGYATSLLISMCKYANPMGMNMESLFDDTLNAINNAYDFDTICELCCECLEMFLGLCGKMKDLSPITVADEVITYIKENYTKNLTLTSLSAALKIKVSIVSKAVKTGTGMKFNDYLSFIRIQNSKQKIINTNKKITQIASEVGYNDYCYFASKFKQMIGVLPSDYRKMRV